NAAPRCRDLPGGLWRRLGGRQVVPQLCALVPVRGLRATSDVRHGFRKGIEDRYRWRWEGRSRRAERERHALDRLLGERLGADRLDSRLWCEYGLPGSRGLRRGRQERHGYPRWCWNMEDRLWIERIARHLGGLLPRPWGRDPGSRRLRQGRED